MKYFFAVVIVLLPLHLNADVSGNVTFTDDYIYRSISNSNAGPAVQAGIDYYNDLGIYAGIWASTIDFQLPDSKPGYEFDMYGGITGELATINWDLGFLRFVYPHAASKWRLDAHEFHLGLSRDVYDINIATAYHYSPDYSGAGNSHYIEANLAIPLPHEFTLSLHSGYQTFENNAWYGLPDYTDWRVAVNRDIAGFFVEFGWTINNINNKEACFFGTDWCESKVSIDVHRTFEFF